MYGTQAVFIRRRPLGSQNNVPMTASIHSIVGRGAAGEPRLVFQDAHDAWEERCVALGSTGALFLKPPGVTKTLHMLREEESARLDARPRQMSVDEPGPGADAWDISAEPERLDTSEVSRHYYDSMADSAGITTGDNTGSLALDEEDPDDGREHSTQLWDTMDEGYDEEAYVERGFTG